MSESETLHVGQRIRLLREQQNLSLRALAKECGLSINAISKIERGENSPTVASLHQLASALRVPITEFFREDSSQTTVFVKRSRRPHSQHMGMEIESLGTGLRNQQLEPFLVTIPSGISEDSEPITHTGQEFVYCVDGKITYYIGDDVYKLETGDSLIFEASQPHRFTNVGNDPALILFVFQTQDGSKSAHQYHLAF